MIFILSLWLEVICAFIFNYVISIIFFDKTKIITRQKIDYMYRVIKLELFQKKISYILSYFQDFFVSRKCFVVYVLFVVLIK